MIFFTLILAGILIGVLTGVLAFVLAFVLVLVLTSILTSVLALVLIGILAFVLILCDMRIIVILAQEGASKRTSSNSSPIIGSSLSSSVNDRAFFPVSSLPLSKFAGCAWSWYMLALHSAKQ